MTTVVLPSTNNATYSTLAAENVIVSRDVIRVSLTSDAIRLNHSNSTLTVFGQIYGSDDGVQVGDGAGNVDIYVGQTGVIAAVAARTQPDAAGIDIGTGLLGTSIFNAGEISGGIGIDSSASSATYIANSGSLFGRSIAVHLGGYGTLENSGSVWGSVWMQGPSSVYNTGLIQGQIVGSNFADYIQNFGTLDIVLLGDGDDTFINLGGTVTQAVYGEAGNDTYTIDDSTLLLIEQPAEGTDEVRSTVDYILGDNFENLTLLGAEDLRGIGNALNNAVTGTRGDNVLRGLQGHDTLSGDNGDDLIYGGAGNDTVFAGNQDDRVYGGLGNETAYGGNGDDRLLGEDGNDRLLGQNGNDFILGGTGNDVLNGGTGDDVLQGGAGFDILLGSSGNDTMTGDFNADTFLFADGFGMDVITDFAATNNAEKIDLSGVASIVSFADLSANHMSQVGGNVVIDALGGNTITLLGVNIGDLDANDFVF